MDHPLQVRPLDEQRSEFNFIIQSICPEIWLVRMVGMQIERAIGVAGLYRKTFAGAVIVAATSAGINGVELTVGI